MVSAARQMFFDSLQKYLAIALKTLEPDRNICYNIKSQFSV